MVERLGKPEKAWRAVCLKDCSFKAKMFQLFDNVDEQICRDLRLSTYNSTDECFRTYLKTRIIEDLERISPLKPKQPRKVTDQIQTLQKAPSDLIELESTGAIKNPLVSRSTESKLPNDLKKDWLRFTRKPSNRVTPDNHFDSLLQY